MESEERKQKILEFIKKQNHGVVSTINSDGKCQSAVVAISQNDDLELIFGTFCTARKYQNLQGNKHISVVIGWDEDNKITVQYEGTAEELEGSELELYRQIHLGKNIGSKKYDEHQDQRYFKIKPKWIRYSNFGGDEEEIFEVEF